MWRRLTLRPRRPAGSSRSRRRSRACRRSRSRRRRSRARRHSRLGRRPRGSCRHRRAKSRAFCWQRHISTGWSCVSSSKGLSFHVLGASSFNRCPSAELLLQGVTADACYHVVRRCMLRRAGLRRHHTCQASLVHGPSHSARNAWLLVQPADRPWAPMCRVALSTRSQNRAAAVCAAMAAGRRSECSAVPPNHRRTRCPLFELELSCAVRFMRVRRSSPNLILTGHPWFHISMHILCRLYVDQPSLRPSVSSLLRCAVTNACKSAASSYHGTACRVCLLRVHGFVIRFYTLR